MEDYFKDAAVQHELNHAIAAAKRLFNRNKVSGSSANISFRIKDKIFVSASGSSFADLCADSFSVTDLEGKVLNGVKPSKELPLHLSLYSKSESYGAVLHTHSFYSTLWACLKHDNPRDVVPKYTPYLEMKLGKVGLVPYADPGSAELFALFDACIDQAQGFLLANHGPIVPGKNILDAFYIMEELEESCHIAWELMNMPANRIA